MSLQSTWLLSFVVLVIGCNTRAPKQSKSIGFTLSVADHVVDARFMTEPIGQEESLVGPMANAVATWLKHCRRELKTAEADTTFLHLSVEGGNLAKSESVGSPLGQCLASAPGSEKAIRLAMVSGTPVSKIDLALRLAKDAPAAPGALDKREQ
jgi:hypothetical protein